jgi:threonine dehydratase
MANRAERLRVGDMELLVETTPMAGTEQTSRDGGVYMPSVDGPNGGLLAPERPPSTADVRSAQRWLGGRVLRTPVVRAEEVDRMVGRRVWLKAENLQHTGSYKVRGATLALSRLMDALSPLVGVVVQSTGNHGIATAHAARALGVPVVVVLPEDAAPAKVARIGALGAEVVRAGVSLSDRLVAVERVRQDRGFVFVDAFDHPDIVVGQGTATAELMDQVAEGGGRLDAVVVPAGGGGGAAGACLAATGQGVAVYAASPAGCDSLQRSLAAGTVTPVQPKATLADGLRLSQIGQLPFQVLREQLAGVVEVDDGLLRRAMCVLLYEARMLVEPSGAAGLAAVLAGGVPGGDVGVLLTGGNVEPAVLQDVLSGHVAEGLAVRGERS